MKDTKVMVFLIYLVVVMAVSSSEGGPIAQNWIVQGSPVISSQNGTAAGGVSVIKTGSGYTAWFDNANGGAEEIRRSDSSDGISWSQSQGVYVPTSTNDALPKVVLKNDTFHMWAGVGIGTDSKAEYATSSDGTNWQRQGVVSDFYYKTILSTQTGFEAWFKSGNDFAGYQYATSADGLNWETQGCVFAPGQAGSFDYAIGALDVVKIGETYHMWYSADTGQRPWGLAYATSSNGIDWQKHGLLSGFSTYDVTSPSVMYNDGVLKMWFHSVNSGEVYYAESIPEPATMALLALGGVMLRRRMR